MANILIAGGTGMIGMRLSQLLRDSGHEVAHLSRTAKPNAEFPAYAWDIKAGTIDVAAVERADYLINLAGAGIADKPWTTARKQLITESRTQTTALLRDTISALDNPPKAYLSGAAIGYYGDRGNELLTETSAPGSGFLAESCQAWEDAIDSVRETGIRTVAIRIGIVLAKEGGALPKMLLPLKMGLATYFGNGQQWYSWIHIDDLCRIFMLAIENEDMNGTYNGVAPQPVRNKAFAKVLKEVSGNPALLAPAPAFALRLAMGEMADVVLVSSKVSSEKIEAAGMVFAYPELGPALSGMLAR